MLRPPEKVPEKGFYYHYKHDPIGEVNNAAYEVIGTGWNTESVNVHSENPADFIKDEMVIYRPLFKEALAYKEEKRFWMRPLKNFMENVEKDGKTFPRFQKITDPDVIAELEKMKNQMYG